MSHVALAYPLKRPALLRMCHNETLYLLDADGDHNIILKTIGSDCTFLAINFFQMVGSGRFLVGHVGDSIFSQAFDWERNSPMKGGDKTGILHGLCFDISGYRRRENAGATMRGKKKGKEM